MPTLPPSSEIAIWERVLQPGEGNLPPAAAEFFLGLSLAENDLIRMHELAVKGQNADLTAEEAESLRNYRQVGLQLDLLRSKARQAMKKATP